MATPLFRITTQHQAALTVVAISGRVDALASRQLEKVLGPLIDNGKHRLVLDFSEVPYIVSAGLGVLLRACKQIGSRGSLELCQPSPEVRELLTVTGLSKLILIHSDMRSAQAEAGHGHAN